MVIIISLAAALLVTGCMQTGTSAGAQSSEKVSASPAGTAADASIVTMTVPFPPVPVQSGNVTNLAYELELAPASNETLVPEKVEVIDAATGITVYSADGPLLAGIYHPAADPAPTASELANGTGKVPVPRISLWVRVSPDTVPDRLVHRLTLNRSGEGLPAAIVTGGFVAVQKNESPVVVGPPMKGDGWVAMETTAATTHHFAAQITMDNITRVPQRYAQDWIYIDPATGKIAEGNVSVAKNYLGFGKEIRSVANGTVVNVLDGLPDNELIFHVPTPTLATAAGNFVIVDIGNRKYACYAHMVNGSIRVKKGDIVTEGKLIGLMGNSGNSDLPHLHFQVVTGTPSFLGAEGYPHAYRAFNVTGRINATLADERSALPGYTTEGLWTDFPDFVQILKQPVHEENRLPENWDIVRFP